MKLLFILIFYIPMAMSNVFSNWGAEKLPISYSYTQVRLLASTNIKLQSSGQVFIAKDGTIKWLQVQPFEITYTIKKGSAYSQIKGQKKKPLNNPIFEKIIIIIESAIKGEFHRLEELFKIEEVSDTKLNLTPKDAMISKAIQNITFSMLKNKKRLQLNEKNGNNLLITFSLLNK